MFLVLGYRRPPGRCSDPRSRMEGDHVTSPLPIGNETIVLDDKRTLTRDLGRRANVSCGWFKVKPYRPCTARSTWLLIVEIEAGKRAAHTTHYTYCDEHAPKPKPKTPSRDEPPAPGMVNSKEAAALLGISIWALHQRRHRGLDPDSTRSAGVYWYRRADIEAMALSELTPFQVGLVRARFARQISQHLDPATAAAVEALIDTPWNGDQAT